MESVLILAEDGFEDMELMYPYYRLQEAGYRVLVAGPRAGETYTGKKGLTIVSDAAAAKVKVKDHVAVIIPGGRAPDRMRMNKSMVEDVKEAAQMRKAIGAICHGPQLLIEANVVKGKRMMCYPSIATDLKNAGGIYIDEPVVVDGNFVTSRVPADLPHFCREILRLLGKV